MLLNVRAKHTNGNASEHKAIDDIRLALNQNQPLGSSRFYARIEAMTGQRREAKTELAAR